MGPENPDQPEKGPLGWAVKLDGAISIRTASTLPRGAQVNGLVLFFGVDAYHTHSWTDEIIQGYWDQAVEKAVELGHTIEIVRVICTEINSA